MSTAQRPRQSRRTSTVAQRSWRGLRWLYLCLLLGTGLLSVPGHRLGAQAPARDPVFEASGFKDDREYFGQFPFEHIDALSGNLVLSFTDLVLPGNAGMDLRFVRTYNQNQGWSMGPAGMPMSVVWPEGAASPPMTPKFITTDGAEHVAVPVPNSAYFLTSDFWRWDLSDRVLRWPNGWELQFGPTNQVTHTALLEEVRDRFGNRITFERSPDVLNVRQVLRDEGAGERVRLVRLEYNGNQPLPSKMIYEGREWHFSPNMAQPPMGPAWTFDMSDGLLVTTPQGGTIHYRFTTHQFARSNPFPNDPDGVTVYAVVVWQRCVGGFGVNGGTWEFEYQNLPDAQERTTVTYPDQRRLVFEHGPTSALAHNEVATGHSAKRRVLYAANGAEAESTTLEYEALPVGDGAHTLGYQSRLKKQTIVRDGVSFTTDRVFREQQFADYHRPYQVIESGDAGTRTTDIEYDYSISGWVKDRTKSQTVSTPDEGSATNHAGYSTDTGFKTSETSRGITTTFTPTPGGNVASATDGHQHTTLFTYDWGVLKDTTTPEYPIAQSINPDGTVASVTRRGHTTRFEYDHAGRLEWVKPARGHWTQTLYDDAAGRWVETRRSNGSALSAFTRTTLDGFGRPVGTQTAEGVMTETSYDPFGRKSYDGRPYRGDVPNHGIQYEYDALGRIEQTTDTADNATTTIRYERAVDRTITDPEQRVTVQDWAAFGNPGAARLASITDAEGKTFGYGYDVLGNLRVVNQPGAHSREWHYHDGTSLLSRERHPEQGDTLYTYDHGRLATKRDARGVEFVYGYDGNDRLTSVTVVDAPHHDVTFGYDDSDNRTLVANSTVRSRFEYDEVNRMFDRRDTWAGGPDLQTRYWYDDWDNLETIRYPSQTEIKYRYDLDGRVTRAERNEQLLVEVTSYHPSGAVRELRYGNEVVEQFEYDHRGRLEAIVPGAHGPQHIQYTFDRVGNLKTVRNPGRGGFDQDLTYDNVDRLKQVMGFGAVWYDYDELGNRRAQGNPGEAYPYLTFAYGEHNRLEEVTGMAEHPAFGSYGYENNGNLRSDRVGTYDYTPFNMLERATVSLADGGTREATYQYDGDAMRKLRTTSEGTFAYLHGPGNVLLAEYEVTAAGGELRREYFYLGSRLVGSSERVSVPGPPLTVRMTSPAGGHRWANDEPIELAAVAATTEPGDSIDRVEFYRDGIVIGSVLAAPYEFSWTPNIGAGTYLLMARAVTALGKSVASAPVSAILFAPGRVTGVSVSPATPAVGQLATVTVTGNMNPCGAVGIDYGDGRWEVLPNLPDGGPLSLHPFVNTHSWTEGGFKRIIATGHGNCRGTVVFDLTVTGPSATVTTPAAGASFVTPAVISLAADASDTSGQSISRVDFYANGALLGSDSSAPYTFSWSGAPVGTHALVAKAVNAQNVVGASAPVSISVVPPPLLISVSPAMPAATMPAQIRIEALAGCSTVTVTFGDGRSDTFLGVAGEPIIGQYAWTTAGPKTIRAQGQGAACPSRGEAAITVLPPPTFAVTVEPSSPIAGSAATVTVTGPGACTTVNIDLGDGTTATLMGSGPPLTRSHTWTTAGVRTVAALGLGAACNYQASTQVTVQPPASPLTLGINPSSPVAGTPAQVTVGAPATCTAVAVDFGDGTSQTFNQGAGWPVATPHTWFASGSRTLTATGAGGMCAPPASTTITVQAPPPSPLTIIVLPATPSAGVSAEVRIDGPAACASVNVLFGDGGAQTFMGDGPPLINSYAWTTPGSKTITAQGLGAACDISGSMTITVLAAPSVMLTEPSGGTTYTAPATVNVAATASVAQGSIAKVDFYANGSLLGTDMAAPFTFSWNAVPTGSYSLTARATDSAGAVGVSAASTITVQPPPLAITVIPAAPTAGVPAQVRIDGPSACSSVNVYFGDGGAQTFMGSGPPLVNSYTWGTAGPKTITAQGLGAACDITGSTTITVLTPPSVSITAPAAGTTYLAPATVAVTAAASAAQGSIASVVFYGNGTPLGSDSTAPYTLNWNSVPAGVYSLTASATDTAGAVGSSGAVTVVVGQPPPSTVLGLTVTPNPLGAGHAATITVTGTNPCGMLWMDFGDGNWWIAPTGSLPFTTTKAWAGPGTYTVMARGFNDCTGEVTRTVTVTGAPEPLTGPAESTIALFAEARPASTTFDGLRTPASLESDAEDVTDAPVAFTFEVNLPSGAGDTVSPEQPQAATLTVNLIGAGSGTVTSNPAGLTCTGTVGRSCSETFAAGTFVTLTATEASGSRFQGWGGACGGTDGCTVALESSRLVVASFTIPPAFESRFYHTDAIGSVRVVTDAMGNVVRRHDYFPFGDGGEGVAPGTDALRFSGKERDAESGLDYFGARYYASRTGRFTTVDPMVPLDAALRDPQLWNRYSYVRNNPLRYTDPDGRCIWDLCIGEAALVLGVTEATIVTAAAASAAAVIVWNKREEVAHSVMELGAATGLAVRELIARSSSESNIIYAKTHPGKGLRDQIAAHEKKLTDYMADPDAHDNKGFLKQADPERRAKIIDSRIRELQRQLEDFKRQLEKLDPKQPK